MVADGEALDWLFEPCEKREEVELAGCSASARKYEVLVALLAEENGDLWLESVSRTEEVGLWDGGEP